MDHAIGPGAFIGYRLVVIGSRLMVGSYWLLVGG